MNRLVKTIGCVCVAASVLLFGGCSTDVIQSVNHPTTVQPGALVPVTLIHGYCYLTPGKTVTLGTVRDSLYVAFGMQTGWSVVSAGYYVAKHLSSHQKLGGMLDSVYRNSFISDSLLVFSQRQKSLHLNTSVGTTFMTKTFSAHNNTRNATLSLAAASVANWSIYDSLLKIQIIAGTKTDTTLDIKDSMVVAARTMLDSASNASIDASPYDSIGVCIVPIFVFAVLQAPAQARASDTLFYFSKTGKLFPTPTSLNSADKGDMLFTPITVGNTIAVRNPTTLAAPTFANRVLLRYGSQTIQVPFTSIPSALTVFSASGSIVKTIAVENLSGHGLAYWDGNSAYGTRCSAGRYLVGQSGTKNLTKLTLY